METFHEFVKRHPFCEPPPAQLLIVRRQLRFVPESQPVTEPPEDFLGADTQFRFRKFPNRLEGGRLTDPAQDGVRDLVGMRLDHLHQRIRAHGHLPEPHTGSTS